ncbi:hypothetical protein COM97_27270 [Bacillus thuringiensis]|uniref:hypothetical protein n=1 Tax=Bacillus thuringiensis TaxID=1428 RepID=UPI000BEDCB29|nr:hypothetical protein [Bacillus thuringiensis]PEF03443.1 hypothetical protein COM97_27270 [Bacillus thuringiensis]
MVLLIIAAILAALSAMVVNFIIEEKFDIDSVILPIIAACIVFVAVFFGGMYTAHQNAAQTKNIDATELIGLNDGSNVTGRMFLGSGHVDGELVYKYAYKKGEGYNIDMIRADSVDELRYIKDGSKPRIERQSISFDSWTVGFLIQPFSETKTIVYVPEGTIQNTFTVDLE